MRKVNVSAREKFISLALATGKKTLNVEDIWAMCNAADLKYPQWFTYIITYMR